MLAYAIKAMWTKKLWASPLQYADGPDMLCWTLTYAAGLKCLICELPTCWLVFVVSSTGGVAVGRRTSIVSTGHRRVKVRRNFSASSAGIATTWVTSSLSVSWTRRAVGVLHVGHVPVLVGSVAHHLNAIIWQENSIFAIHAVIFACFRVSEILTSVWIPAFFWGEKIRQSRSIKVRILKLK